LERLTRHHAAYGPHEPRHAETPERKNNMERAIEQILIAFARGEINGGSIDWFDLELAFEFARKAMPGRYSEIVREMGGELLNV
jgi:hypothetical protein